MVKIWKLFFKIPENTHRLIEQISWNTLILEYPKIHVISYMSFQYVTLAAMLIKKLKNKISRNDNVFRSKLEFNVHDGISVTSNGLCYPSCE